MFYIIFKVEVVIVLIESASKKMKVKDFQKEELSDERKQRRTILVEKDQTKFLSEALSLRLTRSFVPVEKDFQQNVEKAKDAVKKKFAKKKVEKKVEEKVEKPKKKIKIDAAVVEKISGAINKKQIQLQAIDKLAKSSFNINSNPEFVKMFDEIKTKITLTEEIKNSDDSEINKYARRLTEIMDQMFEEIPKQNEIVKLKLVYQAVQQKATEITEILKILEVMKQVMGPQKKVKAELELRKQRAILFEFTAKELEKIKQSNTEIILDSTQINLETLESPKKSNQEQKSAENNVINPQQEEKQK